MKKKNSLIKSIQLNLWGTVVVVLLFTTLTGYVSWDGITS